MITTCAPWLEEAWHELANLGLPIHEVRLPNLRHVGFVLLSERNPAINMPIPSYVAGTTQEQMQHNEPFVPEVLCLKILILCLTMMCFLLCCISLADGDLAAPKRCLTCTSAHNALQNARRFAQQAMCKANRDKLFLTSWIGNGRH